MDRLGYGLIQTLLWNLKGNVWKRLWPNTDIIVEIKRKWIDSVMA